MKILVLSFYYTPDLCAGSFRTAALVKSMLKIAPANVKIDVVTTMPNRYESFRQDALEDESENRLQVYRAKLPNHSSGVLDQTIAYFTYVRFVLKTVRDNDYDLVYGTSSRLMTAVLSAFVARKKKTPLYLDIRDIFVDTIGDVFPNRITFFVKPMFSLLERWTIGRASCVNFVSEGFREYFEARYANLNMRFFTNGIDSDFMSLDAKTDGKNSKGQPLNVVYAGNIGEGQGLHLIIPTLAKSLGEKVHFRIIGDGGRKQMLLEQLAAAHCENVTLLPPMPRIDLINEYMAADVLFLHLNDYDAFLKVLPSKLFEYGATGKPIWAGVAGYAGQFITKELSNAAVFQPCDVDGAASAFHTLDPNCNERKEFVSKFSRESIMNQFAKDILGTLKVEI